MPWPDADDQGLIEASIAEWGDKGYGLCYLLGRLRALGMSSQEADQYIRATYTAKE